MKAVFAFILTLVFGLHANGCRDPLSETRTFFIELPAKLKSKPVVAKIRILSVARSTAKEKITKAKVVSATRGIDDGATIQIASDSSSCSRDPELHTNDEYVIAGIIDADGYFRGIWRDREIVSPK